MFNTVSAYMEKNKSTWEGNKAIAATQEDLKNGAAAIAAAANKQQLPISGVVEEKEMVRHELEEKILEIAAQLSALADVNGDVNTAAQVEVTLASLDKLPDDQLEATAKNVAGGIGIGRHGERADGEGALRLGAVGHVGALVTGQRWVSSSQCLRQSET